MDTDITRGQIEWNREARHALDRGIRQVRARVRRYAQDPTRLEARFSRLGEGWYEARLTLALPGETLTAHESSRDLTTLVRESVFHLLRELDGWRLRANPGLRARVIARAARQDQGMLPKLTAPTSSRNEMLSGLLPTMLRFARHEVAVRQVRGDLEPGWLDPAELVEEAVAQALPAIPERAGAPEAARLLSQAILAALDAHVAEAAMSNQQDMSMDAEAPSIPPHLASSMQDNGIYDFWQPEETLLYEDLVADPEGLDPENSVDDIQVREALVHALFRLPDAPRRVFEQVVLDGWSDADVAAVSVLREGEVGLCVEDCLNRLSSLLSVGARLPATQVRALYEELGRMLDDERRARAAELVSYDRDSV